MREVRLENAVQRARHVTPERATGCGWSALPAAAAAAAVAAPAAAVAVAIVIDRSLQNIESKRNLHLKHDRIPAAAPRTLAFRCLFPFLLLTFHPI